MHHLLATVEDGDSRELLYRLTLIPHPFALEDVQALATVPEAVPRPRERLDTLGGLWIQRDAGQRYAVSPLVATFGVSELTQATAQGCHRVLGERIVAQRAMTPPQIVEAIAHFHDASEYDRAGALLAWELSELNRRSVETPDFGLLSAWEDQPLPSGMSLGIRMYARALQVVGRIARGIPVDEMLADLDALVAQAAEGEAWALLGVVVATAGLLDAEHALRYLRTACQLALRVAVPMDVRSSCRKSCGTRI